MISHQLSRQIILASQSPQRQNLLATLGISFRSLPADIDEKAITDPDQSIRARNIAEAKLLAIHSQHPSAIVIAADTYVIVNGQALEKPTDLTEAKQMIRQLSSTPAIELTGFAYQDDMEDVSYRGTIQTTFRFRELSEREIDHYVENNPVTTWSAAFSPAYDAGIALVAEIEGSMTSFTHGLPLDLVVSLLRQSQVAV